MELGCPEEALACYRQAVVCAPGYALGHWNLALLGEGDLTAGGREYEWRWHWPAFPEPHWLLSVPNWRGANLWWGSAPWYGRSRAMAIPCNSRRWWTRLVGRAAAVIFQGPGT